MGSQETSPDEHVEDGRRESANQRADRNWSELLQELRVMQTGTQILTGFLLAVAFQQRFTEMDTFQLTLYIILVILAAIATVLVLAPVSVHRLNFRRHLKPEIVTTASRLAMISLAVVGVLTIGVAALVIDFVVGRGAGITTIVLGFIAVAAAWLLLPRFTKYVGNGDDNTAGSRTHTGTGGPHD